MAEIVHNFDRTLNFTQKKQLELTSDIHDYQDGNKQRVDELESQINKYTNNFKRIERNITTVQQKQIDLTNLGHANKQEINRVWLILRDDIYGLTKNLTVTFENKINNVKEVFQNQAEDFKGQLKIMKNESMVVTKGRLSIATFIFAIS